MNTLGITHSVCETCRRIVPAKILSDTDNVYLEKFCPEHGSRRALIRRDPADYLRTLHYVKPAWVPEACAGDATVACPGGCGYCRRHEQHLCMPIVEITSRCDLNCPACLVDAGQPWEMTRAEFGRMLDGLLAAERQIDILNLSGGEPLLHPDLVGLIDDALARPGIVRVSISTNGLRLLERRELIDRLKERNVVVSLQLDGFDDQTYRTLRGRPLVAQKRRILDLLAEAGISTSLTMTMAGGVNDGQFPALLAYFFSQPHVVSLMIQPLSFANRGKQLAGVARRLSIPEIVALVGQSGIPQVAADDFSPLPCSHPLCFSLAFYLMLDGGGMISLRRLVETPEWLDSLANRTVFGLDEADQARIKDMINGIWSRTADPALLLGQPSASAALCPCLSNQVMKTLRGILDETTARRLQPREAFSLTERRIKSIFIHAFQDAETFDLARVRRCCNGYPQPDGRLMPACVRNVIGRPNGRVTCH